jgi:hypothetical protein
MPIRVAVRRKHELGTRGVIAHNLATRPACGLREQHSAVRQKIIDGSARVDRAEARVTARPAHCELHLRTEISIRTPRRSALPLVSSRARIPRDARRG